MGKRITELDTEEFGRLFTSFEHTAYRLETLQRYDVAYEREPFTAFLAGHPVSRESEWVGVITAAVQAGKTMRRVHVVTEPLTDYLRFEMASYRRNWEAGEDVRILPVTEWPDLPRHDYWLFDSRDLWAMEYTDGGQFLHAEQVDDAAEIVRSNHWRDRALHLAMPYPDYMRSRRGTPASRASS
jgi:hypothetical protein